MAVTVGDIITRFRILAQDEDSSSYRWLDSELVRWINEGYSRIVALRPDATATRKTVTLVDGPFQAFDAIGISDAYSIIDVTRNVYPSKSAIRFIDRQDLDYNIPDWHSEAQSSTIERWSMSKDVPREFVVYPPAISGSTIEIVYAADPGQHNPASSSVGTDQIKLADSYSPILLDYVAYRAYSKDADDSINAGRATAFASSFMAGLGVKNDADVGRK